VRTMARLLSVIFCLSQGLISFAHADEFPTRPIRILVGFGAGGSVDLVARLIADQLSKRLGQQVYVEDRPGGGSVIATEALTQANPDGYTLMMADIGLAAAPSFIKDLPYNTLRDIVPVVLVASLPGVMAIPSNSPARTLEEFIALAKSKPGALNYGSAGVGSMLYLAGELFKSQAKVDIEHIPYKSNAEVMLALAKGDVNVVIAAAPAMMSQRDKLRFLAVSARTRLASLPDVPTFAQAGMPKFDVQNWQGLVVPRGTDPAIVRKLNKVTNDILMEPDIRSHLDKLGMVILGGTQGDFQDFLASETMKWSGVVATAADHK
jgi:tripartite-type tricarboxylate transporter receptor subunit TctC